MTKNDNTIRDRIIKGLELTHKRLIEVKKQRNLDLIVSDNGRVIHINPTELERMH